MCIWHFPKWPSLLIMDSNKTGQRWRHNCIIPKTASGSLFAGWKWHDSYSSSYILTLLLAQREGTKRANCKKDWTLCVWKCGRGSSLVPRLAGGEGGWRDVGIDGRVQPSSFFNCSICHQNFLKPPPVLKQMLSLALQIKVQWQLLLSPQYSGPSNRGY